jgi:phytoene dehydrogenase-like protein
VDKNYHSVIIGAGMSGLAAGIRLAQYGKRVLILEKHHLVGGLNSFYSRLGRKFDVGLHAVTNFVRQGIKQSPLNRLLRQLRLTRELFDLCEQNSSRILVGGQALCFTNDFSHFEQQVAEQFPRRIDAFRQLVTRIRHVESHPLEPFVSARKILQEQLQCPRLEDILLLPILFYGGSREDDIDWTSFSILFCSIFLEGLARPFEGVRRILRLLTQRFRELGGERRMRCAVERIDIREQKVRGLVLQDGSYLKAEHILSSIGYVETMRLCGRGDQARASAGKLAFCESIAVLKEEPRELGWDDTIVFFEEQERFHYRQPPGLVGPSSGLLCLPNNYRYGLDRRLPEGILRITQLANADRWKAILADEGPEAYARAKREQAHALFEKAKKILHFLHPSAEAKTPQLLDLDAFTPYTFERFTGHINGAIYGTPHKVFSGQLPFVEGLQLCGTDQGYLGIIGSMLSGISIANRHLRQG